MGYIAQPATQCSAYRPVKFKFETGITADVIEKLYVEVYDAEDDTLIAEYRKDWQENDGGNYIFEFDVSGIAQALLAPKASAKTSIFADPDAQNGYSHASSVWMYVKCRPERRSTDNLLEPVGSLEQSDTIYVFNIAQQHHETQSIEPYVLPEERWVLHDPPAAGIDIRVTDAFWMCCILNSDIARARFTLYNTDGTTSNRNISLSWPDAAANSDKKVVFVGVGPRTANASFTLAEGVVRRYTVFLADSSNNPLTQTLTFNIVPKCAGRELRVHWMNARGGADAYTFDGVAKKVVDVKSASGEAPLVFGTGEPIHNPNARGRFRTDIRRSDGWEVETRILIEGHAEWLAELLDTPEAYMELPAETYYLPLVIGDGKLIPKNTEDLGAILKLSFYLANDKFKPRN
jgi:hypothetical protein